MLNNSTNTTALVFTLYTAPTLFPVSERSQSSSNQTMTQVGTNVIAASVGRNDIEGLKDPVEISLKLEIQAGVRDQLIG